MKPCLNCEFQASFVEMITPYGKKKEKELSEIKQKPAL